MSIPKILHQTYKDENNDTVRQSRNSFLKYHPDWEYKFWSNEECESLIKEKLPSFYDEWHKLQIDNYAMKKWDTTRYVFLYIFGGLYADVDVIFYKNIDPIIDLSKKFIVRSPLNLRVKNSKDAIEKGRPKEKTISWSAEIDTEPIKPPGKIIGLKNHFMLSEKNCKLWEVHFNHIKKTSAKNIRTSIFDHVANNAVGVNLQKSLDKNLLKHSDIQYIPHNYVINKNFKAEPEPTNFNNQSVYAEHLAVGSWIGKGYMP